jgi:hypothetical protein
LIPKASEGKGRDTGYRESKRENMNLGEQNPNNSNNKRNRG